MWCHHDGSVYEHSPLGIGGCTRTVAIVVTGAGMFAGMPLTDAQACDDDRFPCPVVSEAASQETAKPAPSAQSRKKATPAGPDKKAQSKVERDARPTATRTKASKPAVQEQAAAPIAQQTSISQNAAEAAPTAVSPSAADQAPKKKSPNEGLVAAAGTVWPVSPNADGVSAAGADAAQAVPANALQVIDANEFNELDRATIATTSWITYLLLIFSAALAAASAMWLLPRMLSMYARRAAGPRIHIGNS